MQTSGGMTIFINDQSATVVIDNCTFSNNHTSMNQPNDTRPVLLKQNGHRGSLLLLSGSYNESSAMITGYTFTGNTAQIDVGAVYLTYSYGSQNNLFYFCNNTFTNNTVSEAIGVQSSLTPSISRITASSLNIVTLLVTVAMPAVL